MRAHTHTERLSCEESCSARTYWRTRWKSLDCPQQRLPVSHCAETDWLENQSTDWLTKWSTDWLAKRFTDWQRNLLTASLLRKWSGLNQGSTAFLLPHAGSKYTAPCVSFGCRTQIHLHMRTHTYTHTHNPSSLIFSDLQVKRHQIF